jgi:hypothetical protein
MAKTLGAGGDGVEGTGRKSTRSHGQADVPSRDLSNAPHLDGELRRKRSKSSVVVVMATQSPELEREEKETGNVQTGQVRATEPPGQARPGMLAPTGGPGLDKWARSDRWGQESFKLGIKIENY